MHRWKKIGVLLTDDFETYSDLYDHYLSISACEECGESFDTCRRCLDHDHNTGLFRNVLCNGCNRRRAVGNRNNVLGIKYISKISVTRKGRTTEVYRIQFVRKGMKYFKQILSDKMTIEEVIQFRNDRLMDIDGNLDSISQ